MCLVENIPDSDKLYLRVHKINIQDGDLLPAAFVPHGMGMSTDWEKHSTPSDTKNRAKKPELNGVISLVTGKVRRLGSEVIHSPSKNNKAHTEVYNVDEERRLNFLDIYNWEISINE